MTTNERNDILEAVDLLRMIGGNGFSNLQPKIKRLFMQKANRLKEIVENDIRGGTSTSEVVEDWGGETIYED